jgi:hypothetical protein
LSNFPVCLRPRSEACTSILAAVVARALLGSRPSENREGAGKAGYRLIPAAPVRIKMHGAGTTGSAGNTRPSLRDGLTAYSALSPGTGLFCPRHSQSAHCALQDFSASVGAPGPHGLAVRESLARERHEGVGTIPSQSSRRRISSFVGAKTPASRRGHRSPPPRS